MEKGGDSECADPLQVDLHLSAARCALRGQLQLQGDLPVIGSGNMGRLHDQGSEHFAVPAGDGHHEDAADSSFPPKGPKGASTQGPQQKSPASS